MKTYRFLFFAFACIAFSVRLNAQIGINTPTPEETSILDLNTSERGILIPRMTSQRRMDIINQIGAPAEGLLVFDTDEEMFYFYNPNNADGDNTDGDLNWQAVNPLKYVDSRDNLQGSEYLRKIETHASVQDISLFENTPASATNPRLYVDGQVTIGTSNVAPDEARGLYVDNKLQVTDDVEVEGRVTANNFVGNGTVPIGGIIMWSGYGGSVPSNYRLCDGSAGTPNLTNRFIRGGSLGQMNSTGGTDNQTLTVANMPSHTHSASGLNVSITGSGTHTHTIYYSNLSSGGSPVGNMLRHENTGVGADGSTSTNNGSSDGGHSHSVSISGATGSAGTGSSFDNRPSYYVLAFIMRVQ
jgi:microcystin-dependent protein